MDAKNTLPWWAITLIVLSSILAVIILSPVFAKAAFRLFKSLNYAAPIFPMLVIILPLILGAGVSWWVAIQFIWFSLMLVSIVTVNLMGSKVLIPELTKLIPVNVLALLAVLIPTITTPASLGMSTVGAVFTALYSILGLLLLTLVGLGKGNFIAGAFYLFPLIKTFLYNNRVRVPVVFLFLLYTIFSIFYYATFTKDGPLAGWATAMNIFNYVWAILGVFVLIWVYAASSSYFPGDTGTWERVKQIFAGNAVKKIVKTSLIFLVLAIAVFAMIGLVSNIPITTTVIVQVITTLVVLYMLLQFILNNPRLLGAIMNNSFVKLIFNIVFAIPCVLTYFMNNGNFMPPKSTWYVLFVEIIIISLYVFLPMFRKWFYLWSPTKKNRNSTKNQRMKAAAKYYDNAIKEYNKEVSIVDKKGNSRELKVNWAEIYEKKLYEKSSNALLIEYLKNKGFKNNYSKGRENAIVVGVFGKPITLEEAITFIQIPNKLDNIMKAKWNISNAEKKYKTIENEKDENGKGPFTSKILLNKPYYINKVKYLGLYENLKGAPVPEGSYNVKSGVADEYNYNYGLSCWIYILPQGSEYGVGYSQCTKVFDYGSKPTIWYNPDKNKLTITVKTKKSNKNENGTCDNDIVYTSTELPLQRWNNFVINYIGGTLDIFINNKLVASVENVIPYMSPDNISIGDTPGISGSVAAVAYFSQPISKSKISILYNNLVNKDPPII